MGQTTRLLGFSLLSSEGTALVADSRASGPLGDFLVVSRTTPTVLCHTISPLKRLILRTCPITRMDISELKAELEKLHQASFGWALNCCRHNHADAEEVLQSVYLKILLGKAVYRGESKLQTWLFAVIRKTAINERRKQWLR